MKIHNQVVDEFLDDFSRWRSWLDTAPYADVVNDADGVRYPGICSTLPDQLRAEILFKLQAVAGLTKLNYLFARLSLSGVHAPHWAHNDASMGTRSMMLYMNRADHCSGGTSLLEHRDGEPTPEVWARDTNKYRRWREVGFCRMAPNRAFIFRAGDWHAAMPIGGFGGGPTDGRLVVTAFFE